MFKGLSNLANLGAAMGKLQSLQTELKEKRVTGAAGGGLIEVEANGAGEVAAVKIDASLFAKEGGPDREMIEGLLPAAFNDASAKAKQLHAEAMQSLTGDLNLPGLGDALQQFTGGK
ncbi:MAG: YbaB/EbfC family nucleoid-associated protein [Planctomycetota bacterium]